MTDANRDGWDLPYTDEDLHKLREDVASSSWPVDRNGHYIVARLLATVDQLRMDLSAKLRLDGQSIGRDIAQWMRSPETTLGEAWNEGAHAGVNWKTEEPQVHSAEEVAAFFALNPYRDDRR
jgi:hypothetical protein